MHTLRDVQKKREGLEVLGKDLEEDTSKLSNKHNDIVKEQLSIAHGVELAQQQRESYEREHDSCVKDLALVKERETALMGDK